MCSQRSGFDFSGGSLLGPRLGRVGPEAGPRPAAMFEAGEIKFVILRLLKDKPRHGYEVIKALEERMAACYMLSPGTLPHPPDARGPGLRARRRGRRQEGLRLTPDGLKYLEEHRDLLDEIVDRVRETVRDFTGGAVGEVQSEFARLARTTFRHAWRRGPDDPTVKQVAEILKRAADEIEQAWQASTGSSSTTR